MAKPHCVHGVGDPGISANAIADLLVELVAAQDNRGALDWRVPMTAQELDGVQHAVGGAGQQAG